jgi:hypothetical protein
MPANRNYIEVAFDLYEAKGKAVRRGELDESINQVRAKSRLSDDNIGGIMSWRVDIEPMRGRLENRSPGDYSGFWKVVAYDEGSGSIIPRNPPKKVIVENLPYEEALRMSGEVERKLNANS